MEILNTLTICSALIIINVFLIIYDIKKVQKYRIIKRTYSNDACVYVVQRNYMFIWRNTYYHREYYNLQDAKDYMNRQIARDRHQRMMDDITVTKKEIIN